MKRSTDRILTTHTGSLPRPPELLQLLNARDRGEAYDEAAFDAAAKAAAALTVQRQTESGIDIINDGEVSKISFNNYVRARIAGLEGPGRPRTPGIDQREFPQWAARAPAALYAATNNGPLSWKDFSGVEKDIANLKAAVGSVSPTEVFMTSVSPGTIVNNIPTTHYPNTEAYAFALADILKREYKAIVDAGFVLQVDAPDLGLHDSFYPDLSVPEFVKVAEMYVAAINQAIGDLPADRVRMHVCWGSGERPSYKNVAFGDIADACLKAKIGAISVSGANGHHAAEYHVWEKTKLPDGMLLIPGVIDSTTNIIEHPEVVAERLIRYADRVGKENLIAGVDCGFNTQANSVQVDGKVTYAKLHALAEGSKLASERLWK